jgi:hypothetical protein
MKLFAFQALTVMLSLSSSALLAQDKLLLYYGEDGKGLDSKKKATFYRSVTLDKDKKPVGIVEDFYLNGKPLAKGEASVIDKFDNNNTRWKGLVTNYDESGDLIRKNNYDIDGQLDGIQEVYNNKGVKTEELEYVHGNPSKDYYLVFDKKGAAVKYSYLLRLPMQLATTDKDIVPIIERKVIFHNDQPVQFYLKDGLTVAVKLSTKQLYGSYFEAYVTIENGSGPEFTFDPSDITASLEKAGEVHEGEVLTFSEYDKKVKRRQNWTAAFSAFAEMASATSAGYSSSTTTASARSSSGAYAYGKANTTSYNGAAQYAATQNAANNIGQLANQQYNIRQTISEGYLKKNTIFPNSRIVGFINIKYQDADHILLNVPVNGKVYHFEL